MTGRGKADLHQALNQQILEVRAQFPELYEFIINRETRLNRLLEAVPCPPDIERAAAFDAYRHLRRMQCQFQPIFLVPQERSIPTPRVARGHLRLLEFESAADGESAISAEEAERRTSLASESGQLVFDGSGSSGGR